MIKKLILIFFILIIPLYKNIVLAQSESIYNLSLKNRFGSGITYGPAFILLRFDDGNGGNNDLQYERGTNISIFSYYHLNNHARLEFSLQKTEINGTYNGYGFDVGVDINVKQLSVDIQYGFPISFIFPYVRLGLCYIFSDLILNTIYLDEEYKERGESGSLGYVSGIGADFKIYKNLTLGIDSHFTVTFPNVSFKLDTSYYQGIIRQRYTIAVISIYPRVIFSF